MTTPLGLLKSHLFKVALHGLVGQQQDGPHQVSHQDEVPLGLQVEGHDVVVVVALGPQLLLGRPLVQPHLKQMAVGDVFGGFFVLVCFRYCRYCRVGPQKGEASFKQLLKAAAGGFDGAADTSPALSSLWLRRRSAGGGEATLVEHLAVNYTRRFTPSAPPIDGCRWRAEENEPPASSDSVENIFENGESSAD